MPKLRMKETPSTVEAAVLKAERRAKRKRAAAAANARPRAESMTPPRSRPTPLPTDDLGFDESTIPPDQARKRAYREEEEEAMERQSSFADRLRNAQAEDEGVGFHEEMMYAREAAAFSYGGAAGVAMGLGSAGAGTSRMDEEEYAEYVRAGMWRRKNKEEIERREQLEKERKVKEEKERVEGEKRRREERDKIRRLEERRRANSEKEEKDARAAYEERWKKLLAAPPPPPPTPNPTPPAGSSSTEAPPAATLAPLRFTSFPWPLYPPMPLPPLSWPSASQITPTALTTFLLSHLPSSSRKSTLRQAVLAYHPDRFERLVMRVPEDKDGGTETRERVRELGLRTSQVLNDLMKAGGGI
ncbi:hypothetical protein BCR35DRAFT_307823 [Leucosporidium creatinivorum]|uniref:Uncharacterized protein n=1 Tax=Leucosporidium creatinivorum TaxID=106004 RepID=A0A1Y2EGQ2_9BASI|nr:hypothetical protein BCR35DRAFT_307823 [Leucosporidium creatinivorum]